MKHIRLANSDKVVLVDDEDYERLTGVSWKTYSHGYAVTRSFGGNRTVYMHRMVLNAPAKTYVDHISFDKLDNRKANLRLCSQSQNCGHKRGHTTKTSTPFKGVFWREKRRKWDVSIKLNGKGHYLGTYVDEKDAARAYNFAAFICFGNFAHLNKI